MMDFMDVLNQRYSCKSYDGRPVDPEQLDQILQASQSAPTAKNLQEHHIYVLQSPESLAKMDQVTPCRYSASTVLMVTWDDRNVYTYPGSTRNSGAEDASIIASHLMLAATNCGVNSCWINCANPDQVKECFGLPEHEQFLMFMDLGYAKEGSGPLPNHFSRKPLEETVTRL